MCAQLRLPGPDLREVSDELKDWALGIPPRDVQVSLQLDVVKELGNKIAWVLGSVYGTSYSNMRTPTRQVAWALVKQILKDNGYPHKIGK